MDSYISFRYLNKKLLDQYKGLVPVEIECSRRHYNGVDYDTYSYSTIVYYKKENFNPKNFPFLLIVNKIPSEVFVSFNVKSAQLA